jgi:3-oxoacyl-[acyl-carrier-protein] synthase I
MRSCSARCLRASLCNIGEDTLAPLHITGLAIASALGEGSAPTVAALREGRSGLRRNDFLDCALPTYIGRVTGLEDERLPAPLAQFDCRSNRLAQAGLRQDGFEQLVARAAGRHGPHRIGVYLGTSSSGILEAELAYRHRDPASGALPARLSFRHTYNLHSACDFVRLRLGLSGPACVVSSACSSSAKAFAAAARAIAAGLCDAAVVGGVETLCLTTLHGFASLELLSAQPCRPCDEARDGISLGEAAAYALLETVDRSGEALALLGYGESSDAHHMSTPHPQGLGAVRAMLAALATAEIAAHEVDYLNLHGTGTRNNDTSEDAAVRTVFADGVACSATKGWTGHTLGAAGAVEAVITLLALRHGFVPGTVNTERPDPQFGLRLQLATEARPVARAMSNSFGFGGSNCSLLFGRT